MKDYGIHDIEALTEQEAQAIALEQIDIKGYQVYFIDFSGYFGYSVLVFKNSKQLKYCGDYQLHHSGKNSEELKEYYIKHLSDKLFTVEELSAGAKNYAEYQAKTDFLTNNFVYAFGFVSAFYIGKASAEQEEAQKNMHYCPVAFGYMQNSEDVKLICDIYKNLRKSYREAIWQDKENFRKMMRYEIDNHEVGHSGDWEQMLYSMGFAIEKWEDWQKSIFFEEVREAERRAYAKI